MALNPEEAHFNQPPESRYTEIAEAGAEADFVIPQTEHTTSLSPNERKKIDAAHKAMVNRVLGTTGLMGVTSSAELGVVVPGGDNGERGWADF